MSRIELDAIQNKLKTAIQNHQILVKTKGDQQNVAFKSCLKELQEEIKRLSEEQKKIVVKLRESLVKSSSQPQPVVQQQQQQQPQQLQQQPQTTVTSVVGGEMSTVLDPQTVSAAISQSRLMYQTPQGGATILPVGMVAVPLAHVQRPTLGVTFNGARGQLCTPTGSITLQPGDYANAVVAAAAAAAQLPSGLHAGNSINIPINNTVNNNSTNIALQNSIAINNITNAINVSTLNGNIVNGSINITGLNNPNAAAQTISNLNTIIGSAGVAAAHPIGSIVIGSKALTQLTNNNNINNNVALTTVVNSQSAAASMTPTLNGNNSLPQSNALGSGVGVGVSISSAGNQVITLTNGGSNHPLPTVAMSAIPAVCSSSAGTVTVAASHLSTIPTVAKDQLAILQSQIPQQQQQLQPKQQQPQQQQQQQTIQTIQTIQLQPQTAQQQQQQKQQCVVATSANFPIKVPHYTASPTRTTYCSIAPAPGPALPTPMARQAGGLVSAVATTSSTTSVKKSEAVVVVKPSSSKISTLSVPNVAAVVNNKGRTMGTGAAAKAEIVLHRGERQSSPVKSVTAQEDRKHQFMKALDLYAPEMLKDLLNKRNERKRRTTANPHYSIGFQSHRWQRNDTLTDANPFKKAKVGKERKPTPKTIQTETQAKKDKMSDSHDDFCAACGKGGPLLMCETCRLVYHLDCLNPPLTEAPQYAWSCPKCLVSGKGSANLNSEALSRVHSYIGKRIAKEDEKKKQQRKGAEIRNEKSFLDSRSKKLETEMKDHQDSKRKLDEKDKLSKKELDQLTVLVQSVRDKNPTIAGPISKTGPPPKQNAMSPFIPEMQAPSNIVSPSFNLTASVSANKSLCKDGEDSVNKENNSNDDSSTVSVIGDDRIVLEFKVSAKEFSEIENNSSRSFVVTMENNGSGAEGVCSMETDEISVLEPSTPLSSSITSPPPTSSPTVMSSCGESLKQSVVMTEQKQQQQLPITS